METELEEEQEALEKALCATAAAALETTSATVLRGWRRRGSSPGSSTQGEANIWNRVVCVFGVL